MQTVRFPITVDETILRWIADLTVVGLDALGAKDPRSVAMARTAEEVNEQLATMTEMRRATVVFECEDFIAFEDPDRGDEAPLWIWDMTGVNGLDKEGPFYDATDPNEISEWLHGMRCAAL